MNYVTRVSGSGRPVRKLLMCSRKEMEVVTPVVATVVVVGGERVNSRFGVCFGDRAVRTCG